MNDTAKNDAAKRPGLMTSRKPELLAPAGDWDCIRAAVQNGADAVYFGLDRFNARMRAENFRAADLPELMAYLHERGVKGYATFNTLVFANEIRDATRYLRDLIAAGVDAAIVQDVGLCRLIRSLSPDFPIHASTQMTVTSRAGVEFARRLGCQLVVLARECSLREITAIKDATGVSDSRGTSSCLPLEVFVHGALCVAYSGQCLTSEALGGRSANRGQCAQACRMTYDLISDGQRVPLGDRHYLLSPQDLSGLELIPDLIKAGVMSFKIEGRLKSPEYVASITRVYRRAIDAALPVTENSGSDGGLAEPQESPKYELEMAFSRGLYTGWLQGIDNQKLVHARFGKKRGVYIGEVISVQWSTVTLRLRHPVKPGDGVVFDAGQPDVAEEGGRVYEVCANGNASQGNVKDVTLSFGRNAIDFSRLRVGQKVWKTNDPELDKSLRSTYSGDQPRHRRPVWMEIDGKEGMPIGMRLHDEDGNLVEVLSERILEPARSQPLTTATLRAQLGRLGGTPFRLEALCNRIQGEVILPVSELNRMRRTAVDRLIEARRRPRAWSLTDIEPVSFSSEEGAEFDRDSLGSGAGLLEGASSGLKAVPKLIPLVRNLDQLQSALAWNAEIVYCDFESPKKYCEAVRLCRESSMGRGEHAGPCRVYVAPPRIFKPGEEWILEQVRSSGPDGYLVRNYDHLDFFREDACIGDFSLNVANEWSAAWFVKQLGLPVVTASYDLNMVQLEALLLAAPPHWFEITIHQHMPMFHMEHCVFCAFLSKGKDYRDCGRPCDKHEVLLRDRVGANHPLKADAGCRNTVFNGLAQTGAEFVPRMLELGVRRFRVEFLTESPEEVLTILGRYQALIEGKISGSQLWRELKLVNQLGVTRGQMDRLDGHP